MAAGYPGCEVSDLTKIPLSSITTHPTAQFIFFQGSISLLDWLSDRDTLMIMGAVDVTHEVGTLSGWYSATLAHFS
jgi:hypothetical protein